MASTYSTNLKLELIGTGDQSGTWGDTTNTNMGTLIEQAIVGYETQTISDVGDTTLTIANGATSVARNYILELTGLLTGNRNLIVPAIEKSYIIYNNTTGGFSVTVKVAGQTGVTVLNGKRALVYNTGVDVIEFANAPVTEAGTQTLTNKTLTTPFINTSLTVPAKTGSNQTGDNLTFIAGNGTGTGGSGYFAFQTAPAGSSGSTANTLIERMRLDSTGRLLINYTTPVESGESDTLLIQSHSVGANTGLATYRWTNDTNAGSNRILKSRGATIGTRGAVASGDNLGRLTIYGDDGTTFIPAASILGSVDGTTGTNDMPGRLIFLTTADGASSVTERMRIDSAGNVGIGVTPSVSAAATKVLQIAGGGMFVSSNNTGSFSSNIIWDGAWKYVSTSTGTLYYQSNGNHIWSYAASGTAGTTATLNEVMRLTSSGNVGIGTDTPGVKLHISQEANGNIINELFVAGTGGPTYVGRKARGTAASPTAALADDVILGLGARGYGATSWGSSNVGFIGFYADETFTDSSQPSYVTIETTPTGSTSRVERVRIGPDGTFYKRQGAQTSKSAAATLTASEVLNWILQYTGSTATITLPTGTDLDTGASMINSMSFDWSVINTGSGTCTIAVNTGITAVGALTVSSGSSATFRIRKTAANTFTIFRIA